MHLRPGAASLERASFVAALLLAACSGGSSNGATTARAPSHSGQVWELDHADDRSTGPGALKAFVSGLDLMVVDGNDLYTGTTRRHAQNGANGARDVSLDNGLTAQLVPAGNGLALHFSSGEQVPLRQRTIPAAR